MPTGRSSAVEPDGRRERWRKHRETRREQLIAAVLAVVEEHGPDVGMDDIAGASGIAKPVFYRYFTDKADLFRAVGRSVAEVVVAGVTAAIDAETEPRATLAAGIDAYLRLVEERPGLYRFVMAHGGGQPAGSDGDPVLDYATVVGAHASRVIGDYRRAAGLDAGAAEPWGFGLVGLVRAATDRWLETGSMSREAMVGYLTALVGPALAPRTPSSERTPSLSRTR